MCYAPRPWTISPTPAPVVEEISEPVWDQVAEGQPVLLVRDGIPAAVVVDVESWQEAVQLAELAIRPT